ncbi:MAG: Molybdate-binding periplasmic protein [Alphaproteobacteria bacterium MarineAlpha9_Bin3]|nr:MAG: Molybdate-binding periplasmic protein [Alphaproteobacteria bacterium MarineAlpha9_Bin3]|tara:strand:- start:6137 stop:6949 length:813 start_codon:yes stop_codon:yes gene_type:complete
MIKLSKLQNLLPQVYIIFLLLLNSVYAAEENILIYNAASTSDMITEISNEWEKVTNNKVRASSSSSSSLAKQIINGAPANIYISASWLWIKELNKKNIIVSDTIKPLFENRLVLIANIDSDIKNIGEISNGKKLEKIFDEYLLNKKRISIADPTHVPAGVYTKQALQKLDLWKKLNRKNMAWGGDVRRTLKFVALGNSPIGIVYYTDAIVEKNVKIIGTFNTNLHKPIHYWVAAVEKFHTNATINFLDFLINDYSKNIYSKHGFKEIENN